MAAGAKNLVKLGVRLCDVSKIASYNPARAIGKLSEIGSVEIGKRADLIIVDGEFNVEKVILRGKELK